MATATLDKPRTEKAGMKDDPRVMTAWGVFREGRVTVAERLAALPTEAAARAWEAGWRQRVAHRADLREVPVVFVQVARSAGHCAVPVPEPREVTVGKTTKVQTWYGWLCDCGQGSIMGNAVSDREMALQQAAEHILATTEAIPAGPDEPRVTTLGEPAAAEFTVSQGRDGSYRKGDGWVTWTVRSAGEPVVQVRAYCPGWKSSTAPVLAAVAQAYGVELAAVSLKMGRGTSTGFPSGTGLVAGWAPGQGPVVAEQKPARRPFPPAPAKPAERKPRARTRTDAPAPTRARGREAGGALHGARPAVVEVFGRGPVDGYEFALKAGVNAKDFGLPVRRALAAAQQALGAGFSVTAPRKGTTVGVVPKEGSAVADWAAALKVAARVLKDQLATA